MVITPCFLWRLVSSIVKVRFKLHFLITRASGHAQREWTRRLPVPIGLHGGENRQRQHVLPHKEKQVYLSRSTVPSELPKHSRGSLSQNVSRAASMNTRRCLGKVSTTLLEAARAMAPPNRDVHEHESSWRARLCARSDGDQRLCVYWFNMGR